MVDQDGLLTRGPSLDSGYCRLPPNAGGKAYARPIAPLKGKRVNHANFFAQPNPVPLIIKPKCMYSPLSDADLEKLALVRDTILKNVRYHYTIPYLAHAAGMNEFKLKTGFKAVYGQPLFIFLTDHRMKLAIQLLGTGNYSVSEIAYRCGYNHPTNFCAAFRRKFNVRPSDFLRKSEVKMMVVNESGV